MTESPRFDFEEIVETNLHVILADILIADDVVTQRFWAEALKSKRWYYWCHASDFESMMIIVTRLRLSFWKTEEEWSMKWIGRESS